MNDSQLKISFEPDWQSTGELHVKRLEHTQKFCQSRLKKWQETLGISLPLRSLLRLRFQYRHGIKSGGSVPFYLEELQDLRDLMEFDNTEFIEFVKENAADEDKKFFIEFNPFAAPDEGDTYNGVVHEDVNCENRLTDQRSERERTSMYPFFQPKSGEIVNIKIGRGAWAKVRKHLVCRICSTDRDVEKEHTDV